MKKVDPQYLSSYPYYSRDGQDIYLNKYIFNGLKNGLFVDIGAYDGIESSNTLFFEETLEWKGICVEPISCIFDLLVQNRKCKCINKCASDHNGFSKFLHAKPSIRPPSRRDPSRTSNYEKMSGLIDSYPNDHKKILYKIIESYGGTVNIFDCQCIDINDVLSMLPSKEINLLSIDTEGSELSILKHINYFVYTIKVIVVEMIYNKNEILELLTSHGYYKVKELGFDWIFQKKVINNAISRIKRFTHKNNI